MRLFLDARGIKIIDDLQNERTINGKYYSDCFNNDLKKRRPDLNNKKVIFDQDNTRKHLCVVDMTKFIKFSYNFVSVS